MNNFIVISIILALPMALIPVSLAEETEQHDYELVLETQRSDWDPEDAPDRVRSFQLFVDGQPTWKDYNCTYYSASGVCSLILIIQNEMMLDLMQKETFNDWYS